MLSTARRSGGFSLIELMVTITLIGILMLLAVPAFGTWSADARVRSAAESLQSALRLAQSSAVARSRTSMFALTSATPAYNATPVTGGSSWYAILRPLSDSDEAYSSSSLISSATVASQYGVTISGPALLCFSSLGQQTTATYLGSICTAPTDDKPASYTLSRTGGARSLKVLVYLGGRVRMCDAAKTLSDTDPDGCPSP